eukprot:768382-Hanusia_phi.AAC.12
MQAHAHLLHASGLVAFPPLLLPRVSDDQSSAEPGKLSLEPPVDTTYRYRYTNMEGCTTPLPPPPPPVMYTTMMIEVPPVIQSLWVCPPKLGKELNMQEGCFLARCLDMPRKRKEPTNAGFYIRMETTTRKCALKKLLTWDSLLPVIKEW